MKTNSIIAAILMLAGTIISCEKETIRVSGEVVRTEVNLSDYNKLRVSDAFNVQLVFSENEEQIIIEANEDIQDKIVVIKEGEELIIRLKRFTTIRGNATMNVFITTAHVNYFDVSGASNVTLDNSLTSSYIEIELSGASQFTGELITDELEVDASGASNLDIYGAAEHFEARLSGASNLKDYDLLVDELDIQLSGASNAFLSVEQTIDISASGASTLNYKGNAVVETKELSGSSEIIKRD